MKRRLFSLLLILTMLTGMASASWNYRLPYAIKVNRALNTVTIYSPDENGDYTVPVKAMICSTGREGSETPTGTFYLIDYRSEWRLMLDGTYGQYATCFRGNFLFHSICYADDSHDAMIREAYNNLGNAASMGCVRLETKDAKWIFDNCPAGTSVTIYDDPDDPGPLGKPSRTVDMITEDMYNGWDPTDPYEGNPWDLTELKSLSVGKEFLSLTAGMSERISAFADPGNCMLFWESNNEAVATVDQSGSVTALSEGSATVTVRGIHGMKATCVVMVKGSLLDFEDMVPGAWYYPHVRNVISDGLFSGVSERRFAPDSAVSRAMVVQVLYNLAGKPDVAASNAFDDVQADDWYCKAVSWAVSKGIISGVTKTSFDPDAPMSREDLASAVWRFAGEPKATAYLGVYNDAAEIHTYAKPAIAWMTRNYLMQGSNGYIQPGKAATRAELASILSQAKEAGLLNP